MVTTVRSFFENAQLAAASYGALHQGISGSEYEPSLGEPILHGMFWPYALLRCGPKGRYGHYPCHLLKERTR